MSFADKKGINIASGFKLQAAALLDARGSVATHDGLAELQTAHAVAPGLKVFVEDEKRFYSWDGSGWVADPTKSETGTMSESLGDISAEVENLKSGMNGLGQTVSQHIARKTSDMSSVAENEKADKYPTVGAVEAYVTSAIGEIPIAMVFKGSVGTGGTITSLPAAAKSKLGHTYKVISKITTPVAAEIGDTVICYAKTASTYDWMVIPSGDEPSGTVTSVGMSVPEGLEVTGSPITSSGTLTVKLKPGYIIPKEKPTADTVTFTKDSSNNDIIEANNIKGSAETLPTILGKIKTWISRFITHNNDSTRHITSEDRTTWTAKSEFDRFAFDKNNEGTLLLKMQKADGNNHRSPIEVPVATDASGGVMSKEMAAKLSGIATKAEVNQNAFSSIKVGTKTVAADTKTDTVEIAGKDGIVVEGDDTNDKLTFMVSVDQAALDSAINAALNPVTA